MHCVVGIFKQANIQSIWYQWVWSVINFLVDFMHDSFHLPKTKYIETIYVYNQDNLYQSCYCKIVVPKGCQILYQNVAI